MTAKNGEGAARPYHHGSLRQALLAAGEAELGEAGVEAFSLRGVARRAGVSHAAPAHHFGDARGLLTALAAEGFRRFLAMQVAREAEAEPAPGAQLVAAAEGYLAFAEAHPAIFRLMFGSDRPDYADAELSAVARTAFEHLVEQIGAVRGSPALGDEAGMVDLSVAWSLVHGFADLRLWGRMGFLARQDPETRARIAAAVLARTVPGQG